MIATSFVFTGPRKRTWALRLPLHLRSFRVRSFMAGAPAGGRGSLTRSALTLASDGGRNKDSTWIGGAVNFENDTPTRRSAGPVSAATDLRLGPRKAGTKSSRVLRCTVKHLLRLILRPFFWRRWRHFVRGFPLSRFLSVDPGAYPLAHAGAQSRNPVALVHGESLQASSSTHANAFWIIAKPTVCSP